MGQKVHPLGFRVGITKKHQSQWFARFDKNAYSQSVLEDRMLRNTLMKLFPDLLKNNTSQNGLGLIKEKRKDERGIAPKITQIKIERGLIPYELGIQIHAENCELIKSSIDKLKIDQDLACYLEKARKFLIYIGQKPNLKQVKSTGSDLAETTARTVNQEQTDNGFNKKLSLLKKNKTLKRVKKGSNLEGFKRLNSNSPLKGRSNKTSFTGKKRTVKLTQEQYRRKKLIQRRLKKRLNVRSRYKKFFAKGLFLVLPLVKPSNQQNNQQNKDSTNSKHIFLRKVQLKKKNLFKFQNKFIKSSSGKTITKQGLTSKNLQIKKNKKSSVLTRIKRKIQQKFVTLYLNKMNIAFLQNLKKKVQSLKELNTKKTTVQISYSYSKSGEKKEQKVTIAPFGYSQYWDLKKFKVFNKANAGDKSQNKVNTSLTKQPITKLIQLSKTLEKKSLKKLTTLKKYFITFGSLSNTQVYSYYQIITFLKNLTQLIRKRINRIRLGVKVKSKQIASSNAVSSNLLNQPKGQKTVNQQKNKTNNLLLRSSALKLANNVDNECRKIKFIEYLKQIVKKHRTENLFYYLSTLSKAKKDLKQIKAFTVKNAQFLFGDIEKAKKEGELIQSVKDVLTNNVVSRDNSQDIFNKNLETSLQTSFIQQIEKQRFISKENLKLTPKVSIKFYSVNLRSLELKASVVSESIVEALEQRKAFRGVIKKKKEKRPASATLR